jgi:hypothetical protein
VLFASFVNFVFAQDDVAYYYMKSNHHPYREFKFIRLDKNVRYVTELSLSDMADNIGASSVSILSATNHMYSFEKDGDEDCIDRYSFRYFILTSQEDAVLYALDLIGGSTSIYHHVSDYDIELGDNAWIDGNKQTVFIRDNICIWLRGTIVHKEGNDIRCAKAIDEYIKLLDKAETAEDIQAPSIEKVEIISLTVKTNQVDGEERTSYRYNISVTAHDVTSNTLYYRTSGSLLATETDGTVAHYSLEKEINCKVFVMNERHLVASKEIFN